MKLHENQLKLILHLIRLNIMTYEDCLKFLDTENTGDMIAMSYVFRPLTKNGYVVKGKDGVVAVLQKGRDLFPEDGPLLSVASRGKSRLRVLHVSRVCMWMEKNDVPISGELLDTEEPYFIPSARWRDIAKGILSTTRFAGVLLAYEKRYAVYDIGDGTMDWQLRAESSLFYYKYGSFKTKADGMILICEDGKKHEIARQIIRQTMWGRKTLLRDRYTETDKPVRYSKSPIKLRTQYEHVYLTTPNTLAKSLDRIYAEDYYIEKGVKGAQRLRETKLGDVELYPNRYYLNPAFDILKLVYFFLRGKGKTRESDGRICFSDCVFYGRLSRGFGGCKDVSGCKRSKEGKYPCLSICIRLWKGLRSIFPETGRLPLRCWKRHMSRLCGYVAILLASCMT